MGEAGNRSLAAYHGHDQQARTTVLQGINPRAVAGPAEASDGWSPKDGPGEADDRLGYAVFSSTDIWAWVNTSRAILGLVC